MKKHEQNDIVTYSNDRSSKIDGTIVLYKRREDLEEKWKQLDGLNCEIWEGILKKVLLERNLYNNSEAEFSICPDFDGDLKEGA